MKENNEKNGLALIPPEEIDVCLERGEGTRIEFKEAMSGVPASLYETIVSFSNKDGGTILLGVSDNNEIKGVLLNALGRMRKDIITYCNNAEVLNPPVSIAAIPVQHQGKHLLVIKVPTSSQVHSLKGVIFDRENDSDIKVRDHTRISALYLCKKSIFTETEIYPAVTWSDLREDLLERVRAIIRGAWPSHEWLSMSNELLVRSAVLYAKDYKTGEEGFNLAGVLLFGHDKVIQSILPAYKIEVLVRRESLDRWDDRLTLRTNLLDSYVALMDFIKKHLPSQFYLEGDQRKDLRDIIFRELVSNILCHREYTSRFSTDFIIYRDKVVATNPNKPVFHGLLDIYKFNPFAKNPNIRRFFSALSWADEIGSGVRNMTKYLPIYVKGKVVPVFKEDDQFETEIPLVAGTPQVTQQATQQVTPQVRKLLNMFKGEMTRAELMKAVSLKDRVNFSKNYLELALNADFVEMTQPDAPNSPTQKYRLTEKGARFVDTN